MSRNLHALPDTATAVASPGWQGSLSSPTDVDWVRLEPGIYALELRGQAGSLRLYQDDPERPDLQLALTPGPTGLTIPALNVPERGLLALDGAAAVTTYSVFLEPLGDAAELEVEPNDQIDQAQELPLSVQVAGALSGPADRDLLELPARSRTLTLTVPTGALWAGFLGDPLELVTPTAPLETSGLFDDRILVIRPAAGTSESLQRYTVRTEP